MSFVHGITGYTYHGCRCGVCSLAKAYADTHNRASRRAVFAATGKLPAGVRHGSANAYRNYGCKCDECRSANAEERRLQRASGATK